VSQSFGHYLRIWIQASRPKTLFAAVTPVILGTACAFSQNRGSFAAAFAALLGALCIQIGTNLANDYWDAKKGADTADRLGPVRVTSAGLLSPRAVFIGMILVFGVACLAGLFLISRAGWPVLWIGVVSILCGVLYTAGPFPLAYIGLGDAFTFVFFGPVATAGTFFVQSGEISLPAILLGCVPGSYSVVLIALNNMRDRESDVLANKKTLAVRFGDSFARAEIAFFTFLPALIPLVLSLIWGMPSLPEVLICSIIALVGGLAITRSVYKIRDMRAVNALFPRTAMVSLLISLLLSFFLLM
jgi:1,4-dihydroxy-2-naphthoate octaprenyltransferase